MALLAGPHPPLRSCRVHVIRDLCLVSVCLLAGPAFPEPPQDCQECWHLAKQILEGPWVAEATLGGRIYRSEEIYHEQGLDYRVFETVIVGDSQRGTVYVDHAKHIVRHLTVPRAAWSCGTGALEWAELRKRVLEFANDVAPHSPQGWSLDVTGVLGPLSEGCLVLSVSGCRLVGGSRIALPVHSIVRIAVDAGRVLEAKFGDERASAAAEAAPNEQTIAAAMAAGAKALHASPGSFRATDVECLPPGPDSAPGQFLWCLRTISADRTDGDSGRFRWATVTFDKERIIGCEYEGMAEGSSVPLDMVAFSFLDPRTVEQVARDLLRPSAQIQDRRPSWEADGTHLVLLSDRPRVGAPWWRRRTGIVQVSVASGQPLCVHPAWAGSLDSLSIYGSCIATTRSGELNVLDLTNGTWFACGSWRESPFGQVALSADGRFLAYSAFRRQGDADIFVDGVKDDLSGLQGHMRIARQDGEDCSPEFSPGGGRVYFAHCDPGTPPKGEAWSVYRVPPGKQYWENTPPELVVGGFGAIGRLSFFPDGRLLVWHDKGLDVVGVEAKTKTPLGLPELREPELPADRPALKLRDPAVSPDGKKLAFSGYRDSGDPQKGTGWYIYTCNLDGSDVKRVTPLADDPVEPYVFPGTGKTAFDVAREMEEDAAKRAQGVQ